MIAKKLTQSRVADYKLHDVYKHYLDKIDNKAKKAKVPITVFRKVLEEYNKLVSQDVIDGDFFKMPFNIGLIGISKYVDGDTVKEKFDFGHYNKTGEKRFHYNPNRDGFNAKWVWQGKKRKYIKSINYYKFVATRSNKRKVIGIINQPGGHKRYFQ